MRLIIFEDETSDQFYPLTYLRAVFELRCGATTLAEKIRRAAPTASVAYFCRPLIAPLVRERLHAPVNDPATLRGDDLLLVNGRWLLLDPAQLPAHGPEEILTAEELLMAARIYRATAERAAPLPLAPSPHAERGLGERPLPAFLGSLERTLQIRKVQATVLTHFWQLIQHNPAAITADFKLAGRAGIVGTFSDHAAVWGSKDQAYVAPTAEVQPFVCLDTTHGPVTIDEGAVVHPHSRIEGPAYIGPKTMIVGGKIREGCSIGPVCRVGGEVEESIIHGYSNKYHDGFLGHAYLGEWVNLGALTTNSDLKNDYGTVQVWLKGDLVDTGDTKVGCFIGDHTKTSIGTILNTGTVVGVMCNVVTGGDMTPKFIPSFSMFLDNKIYNIPFKKTVEAARTAMGRRKSHLTGEPMRLSDAALAVLEANVEITRPERRELVRRSRQVLARERGLTTP